MFPSIEARARVAFLVACGLLPACSRANATAPVLKPTPVKVEAIAPSEQLGLARYSASVEPALRVTLAFRVGGYVEALGQITLPGGARRALDKGDYVKKGTVLARIRQEDYAHKADTARAMTAEARSQEKLALLELEREKRLLASSTISKAEYDAKAAHAEHASANSDAASARQAEAEVALHDTVLRAPIDGVILSRLAEVGALVAPGQEAITIADTRQVKVVFGVPQGVVEGLSLGTQVQVYVDADASTNHTARRLDTEVTRIAPSADALGRVFSVEAQLDNAAGKLRPGSVVSVHVPSLRAGSLPIAIPLASVIRSPQKPRAFSVFVLDGKTDRGTVHLTDVALGEVLGNSVTVLHGLSVGQRVVTVGSTLLRDGGDAVVIR